MAQSRQAHLLVVALIVGVLLSLSVFLLVFFGISGGSVSAQEITTDPVLVGAGDIAACTSTGDEATANLIDNIDGTVVTLGDNVYPSGTDAEFANCYEPSWGRHKARTMPSVGNHEYNTPGASGYFGYFGAAAGDPAKGYYSYDLGTWHIISLNSMCQKVGGCEASAPMVTWLKQDLAANPKACTLAYWHHPLFSSGEHGDHIKMKPAWDALYAADADVVVNGHDHDYERFAPQDPSGVADPARGIREFVVGTGGKSHYTFYTIQPNSEVHNTGTSGVLKLTLHPTGYDWQFVPVAGQTFTDSGSASCLDAPAPPDTTAPTVRGVSPADGATGVAVDANMEATFSEPMDASTINGTNFTLAEQGSGTPVTAAVSYHPTTNKATLDPSVPLNAATAYTATVRGGVTGVKDVAGNAMAADRVWSFTTTHTDTTAPTVISTVPGANATGVDPTVNVTATFSEDMDASSINATTFKLFKKGSTTKLSATISYDAGTDTAALNPRDSLRRGLTYKAVVSTKAADVAGNQLVQQKAWFFTVS